MRFRRLGLCVGVLALLPASACIAADFSADMYLKSASMNTKGKVYASGKMIRTDISNQGQQVISILRLDKRTMWVLLPARKQYMESPVRQPDLVDPASDALLRKNCTMKNLGTEVVNGFTCEKTQYVEKGGKDKVIRCFSKKLNWPVKTQQFMANGTSVTVEMKNVKVGKQPASLFQLPKGYKKMQPPKMPQGGPHGAAKPRK